MDNRRAALRGLDLAGRRGLEIGPLDRPLVTRDEARMVYADHLGTNALRAKYAADPDVNVDGIVAVDLSTGRLPDLLAGTPLLDFVVASHVAEHVPDLVGWLADVEAVLRPGGVLALVLPDKRFTLDLHRREATVADAEAAHAEGRTRPSLGTALDHFLNIVDADVRALWRDPGRAPEMARHMPAGIAAGVIERWNAGEYLDAHCWVVTPPSFVRLVGRIVTAHGLGFRLLRALPTPFDQLEFYVQLEKGAPGAPPTDWDQAARLLAARAWIANENALARRVHARWRRLKAGLRSR